MIWFLWTLFSEHAELAILPVYFPLISQGLKTNKFKLGFQMHTIKDWEKLVFSKHAAMEDFFLSLIVLSKTFKHSVK